METVEFHTSPEGAVLYKIRGKKERRLTRFSIEILHPLSELVRERFPECYSRLAMIYPIKSDRSLGSENQVYQMMSRFIRCNFGEHDLLTQDIDHDIFNFEEVKCPLRGGFCPNENIICKPKGLLKLSPTEHEVANLYLEGFTFGDIAHELHKSPSTVKTQLYRIKEKLKVKNCREIIKVLRVNNH